MTAITYPSTPKLRQAGEQAKKALISITQFVTFLVMLDIMILFVSLAQITTEGQSGYWSPFWQTQAHLVLSIFR